MFSSLVIWMLPVTQDSKHASQKWITAKWNTVSKLDSFVDGNVTSDVQSFISHTHSRDFLEINSRVLNCLNQSTDLWVVVELDWTLMQCESFSKRVYNSDVAHNKMPYQIGIMPQMHNVLHNFHQNLDSWIVKITKEYGLSSHLVKHQCVNLQSRRRVSLCSASPVLSSISCRCYVDGRQKAIRRRGAYLDRNTVPLPVMSNTLAR